MKKPLLLLFFFLFASNAFSQDIAKIPALEKKLKASVNIRDSIDNLALICYNYGNSDPDKGLLYGDTALKMATAIKYEKGIADSYNNIGWLYYRKGNYIKSEEYLQKALALFYKIGNPSYPPVVCSNLGWLYFSKADYPKALKYFLTTLNYAQSVHDTSLLGFHYYNIGVVYNKQGKVAEARKYFQEALIYYEAANKKSGMADAYQSIGNTFNVEGDYDLAMSYYNKSFTMIDSTNDHYKKGMLQENIGDLYFRQKKYSDARERYKYAQDQYIKINSKEDMAYINSLIGNACKELKLIDEALKAYRNGLDISVELNNKNLEQTFYSEISEVYRDNNDFKSAWEFDQRSDRLKDSLFTAEKANELMKLQTQFETEKKEKENKILRAENEITTATLQRNRLSLIFLIVGIVVLLIIGFLLIRNYQKERKHSSELFKLNEELKQHQQEIESINTKLAMKALRSQMNPHFIFNCLNSLQECILKGDMDKANNYLARFSKLLRMILESSDEDYISLSRELQILELYLSMEAGRMPGSFQYSIEVDDAIDDDEVDVPSLLLQPLAENAIWHGLAGKPADRNLKVEIKKEDDSILCIVEDNGVGRKMSKEKSSSHQSKGIAILNERIRLLNKGNRNGFLVYDDLILNDVPAGTRATLRFPFVN